MRTEGWGSENSRESDTLKETWDRQEGALTVSKNISVAKFMFQMTCYHVGVNCSHRWNVAVTAFLILTDSHLSELWHPRAQQNTRRRLTILPTEHDGKQILALCQMWGESSAPSLPLSHSAIWTLLSHSNMNFVTETRGKMLELLHNRPPVRSPQPATPTFARKSNYLKEHIRAANKNQSWFTGCRSQNMPSCDVLCCFPNWISKRSIRLNKH